MIIGIDGNEANVKEQVGVSVYTHNLLTQFQRRSSNENRFIVYLKQKPLKHMPQETAFFTYRIIPGPTLWSRVFFPLYLTIHQEIDLLFCPGHYSPAGYSGKLAVTIHDLAYYTYPDEFLMKDLYKLKNWTAASIRKANLVIAVSQTTQKDIIHYFPQSQDKVQVVYNGFNPPKKLPESKILNKLTIVKDEYLLFVGTLQPRKNITTLIEAFKLTLEQSPHLKLIIVGRQGWMYDSILARAEELQIANSVIFTGFLPEADVQTLYRNAFCYINPSFYEGFGIPILEAMSHGCPVIASNTASLPEIGGKACLYINPHNAQDIAVSIEKLQNDKHLRNDLIAKGLEHCKTFSWEQSADKTLSILHAIVNDSTNH